MGVKSKEHQLFNELNWSRLVRLTTAHAPGHNQNHLVVSPMAQYIPSRSSQGTERMGKRKRKTDHDYIKTIQKFLNPCTSSNKHINRRLNKMESKINVLEKLYCKALMRWIAELTPEGQANGDAFGPEGKRSISQLSQLESAMTIVESNRCTETKTVSIQLETIDPAIIVSPDKRTREKQESEFSLDKDSCSLGSRQGNEMIIGSIKKQESEISVDKDSCSLRIHQGREMGPTFSDTVRSCEKQESEISMNRDGYSPRSQPGRERKRSTFSRVHRYKRISSKPVFNKLKKGEMRSRRKERVSTLYHVSEEHEKIKDNGSDRNHAYERSSGIVVEELISDDSSFQFSAEQDGKYYCLPSTEGFVKQVGSQAFDHTSYNVAANISTFDNRNFVYLLNQQMFPRCFTSSNDKLNGYNHNVNSEKISFMWPKKDVREKFTSTEIILIEKAVGTREYEEVKNNISSFDLKMSAKRVNSTTDISQNNEQILKNKESLKPTCIQYPLNTTSSSVNQTSIQHVKPMSKKNNN